MKYHNSKQIKSFFEKYLRGQCTAEEEKLVEHYLDSFQNSTNESSKIDFKNEIEEQVWQRISSRTYNQQPTRPKVLPIRAWFKYAAVFLGLLISSIVVSTLVKTNDEVLIGSEDNIVLKTPYGLSNLSDAEVGEIKNKDGKVVATLEQGVLTYSGTISTNSLSYNEIMVPMGKTFKLILSDGTRVHLNAGSQLRYPVSFQADKSREVSLSGEAYFEVAKDESNQFIVMANEMEVTVLGTHFNVSSYKDEMHHTVLVEGSVSVNNQTTTNSEAGSIVLSPGQRATVVPEGIQVNEVDAEDYIAWTQNILIFNDEPFPTIIQKIERRYNVQIDNNYKELDTARFNGKFKDESILNLMNTFKTSANFDYTIEDGKIIINNKI